MHNAVNKLSQTKKQSFSAQEARTTLHSQWNSYIADAIQRWKDFGTDFDKQDADLQETIRVATENFRMAKMELSAIQESALSEEKTKEDIQFVEDEDDSGATPMDVSVQISGSIKDMVASLEGMRDSTEKAREEQRRKRPKITESPSGTEPKEAEAAEKPAGPGGGGQSSELSVFLFNHFLHTRALHRVLAGPARRLT